MSVVINAGEEIRFSVPQHGFSSLSYYQNIEIVRRVWWFVHNLDVMLQKTARFYMIPYSLCQSCLPSYEDYIFGPTPNSNWIRPDDPEASEMRACISNEFGIPHFTKRPNPHAVIAILHKLERLIFSTYSRYEGKELDTLEMIRHLSILSENMNGFYECIGVQFEDVFTTDLTEKSKPEIFLYWSSVFGLWFFHHLKLTFHRNKLKVISMDSDICLLLDEINCASIIEEEEAAILDLLKLFQRSNPYFLYLRPRVSILLMEFGIHLIEKLKGFGLYSIMELENLQLKVEFIIDIARVHSKESKLSGYVAGLLKELVNIPADSQLSPEEIRDFVHTWYQMNLGAIK